MRTVLEKHNFAVTVRKGSVTRDQIMTELDTFARTGFKLSKQTPVMGRLADSGESEMFFAAPK